jgi:hypothetical protein
MPMQDIMKELMRNPGKVSKIMRKVSDKLKTTMTSENRQEYVQETMEMLNQMGGKEEFMKMFDQMKGAMGSAANPFASAASDSSENPMAAFANMFGGMNPGAQGKGTKVDQNAMDRMMKQEATKEKMRKQLEAKKLLKDKPDGSKVFRPEGAEPQAKTHLSDADLDQLMKQFGLEEDKDGKGKKGTSKSTAATSAATSSSP